MSARAWFWLACSLSFGLAGVLASGLANELKFDTALWIAWVVTTAIGCAAGLGVQRALRERKDEDR